MYVYKNEHKRSHTNLLMVSGLMRLHVLVYWIWRSETTVNIGTQIKTKQKPMFVNII